MHTDLCRVCACTSEELVPVFGREGSELQLLEKIHIHLPIMVTPEDLLPVTLCTSCIYKLEICHEFVQGCLAADAQLRKVFGLKVDHSMIYDDEHVAECQLRMAKEPSTDVRKEQELYGNMFEDSADQIFSDHMQESLNSEDSVDRFDWAKYGKIPSTAVEHNAEVDLKSVNDIEYEAVHKLCHTKYTKVPSVVTEQIIETDEASMNVMKCEADDFDQPPVNKRDNKKCMKIASPVTEQGTEVGVEGMAVMESEADDFDQHYLLQNTDMQEDSSDQQIHDSLKDAESSAVCVKSRNSRPEKKLKMKTKKPKFRVVIVKMKDAMKMTHTRKFRKAVDLLTNARKVDLSSEKYFLADHMRQHTNERPYECTQCRKRFRLKNQLSNHKSVHANARQHKCPVCGKGFNRRQHMRVHIRTHQQSLKYTCKICKYPFLSVGELLMHRRTHTQEEVEEASKQRVLQGRDPLAFMCQICGKQLASKFTLKNHVMMHADDKPFSCEICGKCFTMKSTLQTHLRLHTGERPYSCQYCGEAFQSKQILVIHERIHTGETPFKCTQCDKAYRSRHSLRQHLLFHVDYRPYECPQCSKRFRRQDILSTHMRTHTGERPFACKVCGRAFKQRGDCNKHQQRHLLN